MTQQVSRATNSSVTGNCCEVCTVTFTFIPTTLKVTKCAAGFHDGAPVSGAKRRFCTYCCFAFSQISQQGHIWGSRLCYHFYYSWSELLKDGTVATKLNMCQNMFFVNNLCFQHCFSCLLFLPEFCRDAHLSYECLLTWTLRSHCVR